MNKLSLQAMLLITSALLSINVFASNNGNDKGTNKTELMVFKTPTCGCCKSWITHLESEGVLTHAKDLYDLAPIKNKYGIRPNVRSCHTAISKDGFAFEGHIPAKYIKQFLSEKHQDAIGLSVPAMPLGSPGMEYESKFMPYKVLILYKNGSSGVYAHVNSYEEQF